MDETDAGQVRLKNLQEIKRRNAKGKKRNPKNLVTGERFSESDW